MNLYQWHGLINGADYKIFALADDLLSAKQTAITNAPALAKNEVARIVNASAPAVSNESTSFIYSASSILI